MTPRTVSAKMYADAVAACDSCERYLCGAQDRLLAIRLELSDVPSKWRPVRKVVLKDKRYYFVQRVIGRLRVGDVCLARWADGWQEVIGHIPNSTAAKTDLLVLVPKV